MMPLPETVKVGGVLCEQQRAGMSVIAPVCTAFEHRAIGQVEINSAVQRQRPREKSSSRQEHLSTALPRTGVNGLLNGGRVVVGAIAPGPIVAHVKYASRLSGGTSKRSQKQNQ